MIRIGRCLPPALAPIYLRDIVSGLGGLYRGEKTINKFEEKLKGHYQIDHCFTLSSGKAALTVILQALKEMSPNRDDVLIPAFTCYSIPSAIIRSGLKISLCDLAPGTFDFDYEQLSAIIASKKERLLCVVPVHLFGFPANLERIREIIADESIFIVEDAAQAMGGEYNGKKMGTVGDVGFFSLGRGKALSTVDGGIIITQRDDIAQHIGRKVNQIRNYSTLDLIKLFLYALALLILSRPSLFWLPKSLPFLRLGETIYDPNFKIRRLSSFQAGLAHEWETNLRNFRRFRAGNVQKFLNELDTVGLKPAWGNQHPLPDLIRLPLSIESVEKKKSILRSSEKMGLGIARTYPDPVDRIPDLNTCFTFHNFPVAKEYSDKLLTLPVHQYITREDRDKITGMLAQVIKI